MDASHLEQKIQQRGRDFFTAIKGEAPSIFNKNWWTGKVMDWSMKNEDFKVKLFRFVDVVPYLTTSESQIRHIKEYFSSDSGELPPVMAVGLKGASLAGRLGEKVLSGSIRSNIEKMGRQFIVGQTAKEAVKNITKLRKDGFAFTIDVLGEATVSEAEADERLVEHIELLDALAQAAPKWSVLSNGEKYEAMDWGYAPPIHLSIKPSAFYSQTKARDFEGSVQGICSRLEKVLQKAMEIGAFLRIDMESLDYKDITIEVYKRLRSDERFCDYPHLGLVLQTYLRCTEQDTRELVAWSRETGLSINVRLVKGAYWDYETVKAKQNGWPVPVYTIKPESDAAFERCARILLENADIAFLACGSHNVRTIAAVMETARALGVSDDRYEFQVLYGMAEPVRKGLQSVAGRVRLYCPYGDLIPGMAYLVRRLLENTANESFLRQSFAGEADIARLLEDPHEAAIKERAQKDACAPPEEPQPAVSLARFDNFNGPDFTLSELREGYPAAIARVRETLGRTHPLYFGGRDVTTDDTLASLNPADLSEVIGTVCQAGIQEIDQAVEEARAAQPAWAALPAQKRADVLLKAAAIMRECVLELSALQTLEVGKQWDQAFADVGEAIDFLEYYAREALRLEAPRRMGRAPGELNLYRYRPKGVAAVIAPWNFPLAISTGMTAAALVMGNAVLYKPSGLASVIGRGLADIYIEAGVPEAIFNFTPGRGSVMGDHLVEHAHVNMIAFTGSMEVGLRIMQKAAVPASGQIHCKKVIAEMGGKNAIIVDDDAELDEAVTGVLYSAFGFQGQKCSACSRVIVLDAIYDRFTERLRQAAQSLKIGPAEDPGAVMGPVVDRAAQKKVLEYAEIAEKQGNLLTRVTPPMELAEKGCGVPITIAEVDSSDAKIAQEEIFGPVLAVLRAKDFDHAIELANSTKFALTGGVYSRSPAHLEQARNDFAVGNLYLNRNCVGALVERQPFGGFNMSGIGSKAGGPDYLLQFVDPVCVTENTMRRGFAPIEEDDDWV